ncbi:MAG: LacI family transcriptional regulator [Faecalibacterium sp.]|nr:LacI family transcriptional regulator [Faecalibacterium sp.]
MAVTIRDVAKAAGVSASTVSRVLNKKGLISAETEQRISAAMAQLHYVPNDMARSFANGTTMTIALAIDVVDARAYANPFFNNTVFGMETAAHERGYNLIITSGVKDTPASAERLIRGKKIDGIAFPVSLVDPALLQLLREKHFPCVIIGHPDASAWNANWVDINNTQAGAIAAQHLLEKGCKKLAYVAGSLHETFSRDRLIGCNQTLRAAGLAEAEVLQGAADLQAARALVQALLARPQRPDAILCGGDCIALGAARAAAASGLKIPQDVKLLCFDDTPITEYAEPSITSISVDTFELGKQAAQILISQIEGEQGSLHQVLLSTQVLERASTQNKMLKEI